MKKGWIWVTSFFFFNDDCVDIVLTTWQSQAFAFYLTCAITNEEKSEFNFKIIYIQGISASWIFCQTNAVQ